MNNVVFDKDVLFFHRARREYRLFLKTIFNTHGLFIEDDTLNLTHDGRGAWAILGKHGALEVRVNQWLKSLRSKEQ